MELGEEFLPNALSLSPVPPARYSVVGNPASKVPLLREKSEKRRAEDPRFIAYGKVLERIDRINKAEELPLNIDERRALAKSEKELSELEAEMDPDNENEDAKTRDTKHDLILQESLRILADYVALEKKEAKPAESSVVAAPPEKKSLAQSITEWLMNRL
jgi:hypothetical protein